ncbi:MAG TPA: phage tail tube protein [Dehalococcoidales bacterium]|nr:phage tail tube protein [Dehalococcoidales bacterium]
MTAGFNAFGTTLKWNGEALAELLNIGGPGMSMNPIDMTSHDSDDTFMEFVAGLRDGGEVSIEGIFIPGDTAGQVAFVTDFQAGTAREVIITGPTAAGFTWTFNALVTAMDFAHPHEDKLSFSATLKVTGKPVLAITASTGLTTPFFSISESAVIIPAAAAATYEYVATVLTAVTSVTVTPTATAGVITVDGNVVATGEASSAITLGAAGTVTEITVIVKETGKTAKTYTIWLARAAS